MRTTRTPGGGTLAFRENRARRVALAHPPFHAQSWTSRPILNEDARMLRPLIPWLGLAAVSLAVPACIPDLASPDDFENQVTALRIEWDSSCPTSCGDTDRPAMCNYPVDRTGCTLYNNDRAADCLMTMQKLVSDGTCSATDKRMQNIDGLCADVFSGCPDPDAEEGN